VQAHGWRLLFHSGIVQQLARLSAAADRARRSDPKGFGRNANVKLYAALSNLVFDVIPTDPARPDYRQGNTLGPRYRHWLRAKLLGRFRLFFRYDSDSRTIVYAWVNNSDSYAIFRRMLDGGDPPNEWNDLIKVVGEQP
jgi:toxin YhaV